MANPRRRPGGAVKLERSGGADPKSTYYDDDLDQLTGCVLLSIGSIWQMLTCISKWIDETTSHILSECERRLLATGEEHDCEGAVGSCLSKHDVVREET